MTRLLPIIYLISFALFFSCNKSEKAKVATYFGGEIINPNSDYVLFYKEETLIDSIKLDENNKFVYQFDLDQPSLYNFRHDEYQYVHLEPNDSVFVRLNTIEFDESLRFSGIGAQKNNFFIKTFLLNEKNNKDLLNFYKLSPQEFSKKIDKEIHRRLNDLERSHNKYNFSSHFKYL